MKTCCFAGDGDEYVLSGSDDFNLYMWKMPPNDSKFLSTFVANWFNGILSAVEWGKSHLVLRGHRSIVNQVRYNKENNLVASSGVEKMVKVQDFFFVGAVVTR
jgi:WD repeat-containing protein 22